MNKWNLALLCVVCLFVCCTLGCSKKVKVTGKVTYTDGTPVTSGKVRFQAGTVAGVGVLSEKGTYSLGEQKDGDGILPGTYKVGITGDVAIKHYDPNNTGITVEVPAGGLKNQDFIVEKLEQQ